MKAAFSGWLRHVCWHLAQFLEVLPRHDQRRDAFACGARELLRAAGSDITGREDAGQRGLGRRSLG